MINILNDSLDYINNLVWAVDVLGNVDQGHGLNITAASSPGHWCYNDGGSFSQLLQAVET